MSSNAIDAYARDVVELRVPAGRYHRLACQRHLRDREHEGTATFPYRFDLERATRFFRFAEKLKHYKGEWAGEFILLQPYQQFRLGSLFGWMHIETGLRRFRTSYSEIPRKNGKSLEEAIVGLYVTFFDGEPGAEGYTIATKRDQAKIVFNDAKKLVQSSGLKSRLTVQVANIHNATTSSKLEPLGADSDSTDGLNPHFVGVDEFHAHKDRRLIDVMETATGARRQPINFQITTAGDDPLSPCGDQHDYACKILDNVVQDETFFAFIAHADQDDDWKDERTWEKANPNYGVSVKPDDFRALAVKATYMQAAANTFKQKRLNIWVNSYAACLSMEGWRRGQSDWTIKEMEGQECYVGVDLASKIDLCALSFVFPPCPGRLSWRAIQKIWTPKDTLVDRAHRDRAPYGAWMEQGWLTALSGQSIDKRVVREAINDAKGRYTILKIGFDSWQADGPIKDLQTLDGFAEDDVIDMPPTYPRVTAACKRVQADILEGRVDARGCPVTAWAVSNAVADFDGNENMKFTKDPKKMRGRIDPLISITIAIGMAIKHERQPEFRYLTQPIRTLGESLGSHGLGA